MVSGDTPTLRLEQDGSSGFQPQTWDVAGNETSFFVRDATNGSTLPFRIFPGSPSGTLTVEGTGGGRVGIGTNTPDASLEVEDNDGDTQVIIEENSGTAAQRTLLQLTNNGGVEFRMSDDTTGVTWLFQNTGGDFRFTDAGDATNEFILDEDGNLELTGTITVPGGTLPDYVFDEGYELRSLPELEAFIAEHGHLPNVPSAEEAAENGLDVAAFQRSLLEKIEELTLYVLDQRETITTLESRLAVLEDGAAVEE